MSQFVSLQSGRKNDEQTNVALKCPHCGHNGTFEAVPGVSDAASVENGAYAYYLGVRKCPNKDCNGNLFFVKDFSNGRVVDTYPVQRIDFDSTNVPDNVQKAFDEALECHSHGSFIAAGIMVRKTLEEICSNQGAEGDNLKKRIKDLGSKVILPQALLDGLDELRLLGNDAAHIESQAFNEVGQEEIEVAIDFLKEFIKAVYQYTSLVDRLKGLKKDTSVQD